LYDFKHECFASQKIYLVSQKKKIIWSIINNLDQVSPYKTLIRIVVYSYYQTTAR